MGGGGGGERERENSAKDRSLVGFFVCCSSYKIFFRYS